MRPLPGGVEVNATRHQLFFKGNKDILENKSARDGSPHTKRIPLTLNRNPRSATINGDIHGVCPRWSGICCRQFGAEHTIVISMAGQRGKDFPAVDDPATIGNQCCGPKGRLSGSGITTLGKWLSVYCPLLEDTVIVTLANGVVAGALIRRHQQIVCQ